MNEAQLKAFVQSIKDRSQNFDISSGKLIKDCFTE